jgi:tRNA(fMet)-specific endonuclease VapC
MAAVVVDTDVVSYLFKRDTRARLYRRHLLGQERIVSFMTLAELDQWAARSRWGASRRAALER